MATAGSQARPDDAAALLDRGNAYFEKGDYDQAIADYDKAIQLMPDDALLYLLRGLAQRELGKNTEAIADLKKSVELTSNPDVREMAEQALSELGVQ